MSIFKGKDQLNLTEGPIGKPLLYLSLPIVITNLLQTAYNLADTFWLGRYSTEALAAISFGFPMVFLIISLGLGVSTAGSVLVAQYTGAGEERRAEFAASQTVSYAFLASVVLGGIGYLVVRPLIVLLGAPPEVVDPATAYLQVISLGLPFTFGFFIFLALMRGYGDTITPMVVMFGTVVLNIAIDPLLIFGVTTPAVTVGGLTLLPAIPFPELGIEGAAYATVFSRGLAMLVGLGIMFSGTRGVQIHAGELVPEASYGRKLLEIGLPASVEGSGRALSINALLVIVGLFSTPVVAAFGIGIRLLSVIFLPAIAVSRGVETMTGQNLGAGEQDRAERANYLAARWLFGILAFVGVLIFLFPRPIVAVFTTDATVIEEGVTFLRFVALTFGFTGIMRAFTGGFRGAGHTMIAAAIAILMLGVIRLPVAWVGANLFGPPGLWASFAVSNVSGAVIAWLWFRRGTWRSGDVRDSPGAGGSPVPEEEPDPEPAAND
jgi:putative MATE family efflux protein